MASGLWTRRRLSRSGGGLLPTSVPTIDVDFCASTSPATSPGSPAGAMDGTVYSSAAMVGTALPLSTTFTQTELASVLLGEAGRRCRGRREPPIGLSLSMPATPASEMPHLALDDAEGGQMANYLLRSLLPEAATIQIQNDLGVEIDIATLATEVALYAVHSEPSSEENEEAANKTAMTKHRLLPFHGRVDDNDHEDLGGLPMLDSAKPVRKGRARMSQEKRKRLARRKEREALLAALLQQKPSSAPPQTTSFHPAPLSNSAPASAQVAFVAHSAGADTGFISQTPLAPLRLTSKPTSSLFQQHHQPEGEHEHKLHRSPSLSPSVVSSASSSLSLSASASQGSLDTQSEATASSMHESPQRTNDAACSTTATTSSSRKTLAWWTASSTKRGAVVPFIPRPIVVHPSVPGPTSLMTTPEPSVSMSVGRPYDVHHFQQQQHHQHHHHHLHQHRQHGMPRRSVSLLPAAPASMHRPACIYASHARPMAAPSSSSIGLRNPTGASTPPGPWNAAPASWTPHALPLAPLPLGGPALAMRRPNTAPQGCTPYHHGSSIAHDDFSRDNSGAPTPGHAQGPIHGSIHSGAASRNLPG